MRQWILGLLAAGALAVAASPAAALDATDGRCTLTVNNGSDAADNYLCRQVTVSQDPKTGATVLRFDFTEGLVMELAGPGLQVNPASMLMGVDRMSWTNPGGVPVQLLADRPGLLAPQLTGKCIVSTQDAGARLLEIACLLDTVIGNVRAEYKVPKAGGDRK